MLFIYFHLLLHHLYTRGQFWGFFFIRLSNFAFFYCLFCFLSLFQNLVLHKRREERLNLNLTGFFVPWNHWQFGIYMNFCDFLLPLLSLVSRIAILVWSLHYYCFIYYIYLRFSIPFKIKLCTSPMICFDFSRPLGIPYIFSSFVSCSSSSSYGCFFFF